MWIARWKSTWSLGIVVNHKPLQYSTYGEGARSACHDQCQARTQCVWHIHPHIICQKEEINADSISCQIKPSPEPRNKLTSQANRLPFRTAKVKNHPAEESVICIAVVPNASNCLHAFTLPAILVCVSISASATHLWLAATPLSLPGARTVYSDRLLNLIVLHIDIIRWTNIVRDLTRVSSWASPLTVPFKSWTSAMTRFCNRFSVCTLAM